MNLPEGVGAAFPPMEAFISSEHFKDSRSKECAVRNPEQCRGVGGGRGLSMGETFGNVWRRVWLSQLGSCYHHVVGKEKRRRLAS